MASDQATLLRRPKSFPWRVAPSTNRVIVAMALLDQEVEEEPHRRQALLDGRVRKPNSGGEFCGICGGVGKRALAQITNIARQIATCCSQWVQLGVVTEGEE